MRRAPASATAALNTLLGGISCNNNTNTTSALWLAYEQIKNVGLPLAYNSIVLFTDGSPNGISANFPVRTTTDQRYGPDYSGTASCTEGSQCNMARYLHQRRLEDDGYLCPVGHPARYGKDHRVCSNR